MIEKVKISIWDIFVTYLSGILLSLLVLIHLFLLEIVSFADVMVLTEFSATVIVFMGIPALFLLGLLLDACSIILSHPIFNGIFKVETRTEKENSIDKIIERDIKKELRGIIQPYFWASYHLDQLDISTPKDVFLAKFGFYRNVASLLYVNVFVILVFYGFNFYNVVWSVASVWFAVVFTLRSEKFYHHGSKAVYGNYFVSKHIRGKK